MRGVPAMEHEHVSVRIAEVRHVTDARVEGLAGERDALRLELASGLLDVGHAQRDRGRCAGR